MSASQPPQSPPSGTQSQQQSPPPNPQGQTPTQAPVDLDAERERRRAEREERRRQMRAALTLEQSKTQRNPLKTNKPTTQRTTKVAGLKSANEWLQSQPTPGGIGALVAALFLLMILVFPVTTANGKKTTRFILLWNVLTGHAKIQGEESVTESEISSVIAGTKGPVAGGNTGLPSTLPPGTTFPSPPVVPIGQLDTQQNASPDSSPLDSIGWLPAIP